MRVFATSAAFLLAATAAQAEPVEELSHGGRYQLMEINEKVIRLDTETGGFEVCRMEAGEWGCQVAREERHGLEGRIAALETRLDRLETARAGDMAAKAAADSAVQAQARAQAQAEADAQARQAAEAEKADGKGVVARLYDYVPDIGW